MDKVFAYCEARGQLPFFEFGGGEVTYLKWFGDFLQLIYERGGLVHIISNASSSLAWWERYVSCLHGASLSFHVEEIRDKTHFINVAQIAAACSTANLHINVMMLPERFDECLSLAQQMRDEVQCSIALQPLFHGFGSGGISGRFAYTVEQEAVMQSFTGNEPTKAIPQPRGVMLVTHQDGSVVRKTAFDLLVAGETNFQGWDCHAGIENIIVTFQGEIYRAWCMQDGPIGSIFDDILTLPAEPTRCRTTICQCGIDICSTKARQAVISKGARI
ncbi:hypothetical protein GCM10007860_25810 [Chitiniphilus shinanonensis]|uniref:Radical SAM domain protein n=1 Tax=Chitiniphilus shinanonensis TaxID=553088 RepID=A0ABQ6BUQ9_9NEIS|nr:hypothetical protein GCM10007860_25810 [Chitiniphilus shinanonensis]